MEGEVERGSEERGREMGVNWQRRAHVWETDNKERERGREEYREAISRMEAKKHQIEKGARNYAPEIVLSHAEGSRS